MLNPDDLREYQHPLAEYLRLLAETAPAGTVGPSLRGYQSGILAAADEHFTEGHTRVLVESMTGSGKTTVGAAYALRRLRSGSRLLWLAHREELITQARDRIAEFGVEGGVIKAGHTPAPDNALQVGSVQSVVRRLKRIGRFDEIVVDEAHHALSSSYMRIIEHYPGARVLGLTATPWRLDGRGLGEVFGAMVRGPEPDDLIKQGFILPARVIGSDRDIDFSAFIKGKDYSIEDMEDAISLRDLDGDAPGVFLQWFPNVGTAAAFCRSVSHAEQVSASFRAAGVSSAVLAGETPKEEREALLGDLATGRIRVICCVDVISEGYDLPSISCVILLRKTKSLSLYLQQVGRALRPSPGKSEAIVLDLVGNSLEHGHPNSARKWSLKSETQASRADQKTEDGEDLSIRRCQNCLAIHVAAPACPYCGHEHEPDVRLPRVKVRELREIEKAELEALQEQRRKQRKAEERKCKTYADWKALGAKRGYNPAWARVQWNLRN